MGAPVSLLPNVLGFAADLSPDQILRGYMLDIVDLIPDRIEARLTNRGAWLWGSQDLSGVVETGILVTTLTGEWLWVQTSDQNVWSSALNATSGEVTLNLRGAASRGRQNPVQLGNEAIHFDGASVNPPQLWRETGPIYANAAHKAAPVGTVYKSMLVTGGASGEENVVRFSVPGKDLTAADSFDVKSNYLTSQRVTGLAALRSAVLIFHAGSVERLRGSTPASSVAGEEGDIFIEKLFDRVGCIEPRSISYWNDYCLFADEHGVHMTDGSTIRNLVVEGLIQTTWRPLYDQRSSIAATVFGSYYIVTVRRTGLEPQTLICNLNTRRWFRFKNIDAFTYISSSGSTGMERIWAGIGTRLGRISPCFFPATDDVGVVDANNVWVQPHFVTPWNRLGEEGRKRIRFLYLSYDLRKPNPPLDDRPVLVATSDTRPPVPEPPTGAPRPPVPEPPPPVPRPPVPLPPYTESGDPNNPGFTFNDPNVLRIGYLINSPTYPNDNLLTPPVVQAGWLPPANGYARYRLPVGKFGYGISIFGDATMPVGLFRLYDIAVEFSPAERSRV